MSENDNQQPVGWERQTLEKIALSAVKEQRRARHWSIFFKSLTFISLFLLLFYAMDWIGDEASVTGDHTALIDIQGVLGS